MTTQSGRHTGVGDRLRMPRTRGGLSGLLLVLAGLWGTLIPFVGPMFDWVVGRDVAWDMTEGRFWLSFLPGVATILGGLIVLAARNRVSGSFGAWLALAGGAWFAVGPTLSGIWDSSWAGTPAGGTTQAALEQLTYHEGLGALIVALAAFALGRMTIRAANDLERTAPAKATEDATSRTRSGRFDRTRATEDEPTQAHAHADEPAAGPRPVDLRPEK